MEKKYTIDDLTDILTTKYNAQVFNSLEDARMALKLEYLGNENVQSLSEFTITSNNYKCFIFNNNKWFFQNYNTPEILFIEYYDDLIIKNISLNENLKFINELYSYLPFADCEKMSENTFLELVKQITGTDSKFSQEQIIKFFKIYYNAEYEVKDKNNIIFKLYGEENQIYKLDEPIIVKATFHNNILVEFKFNNSKFKNSKYLYSLLDDEYALNLLNLN